MQTPFRHRLHRAIALTIVAGLLLTACGDDDDTSDASPTTTQATQATEPTDTAGTDTAGTDTSPAAFCQAHIDVERATAPASDAADADIETALGQFAAAAPAGMEETVTAVIDLAMRGQDETPEFEAAYGDLLVYVATHCDHARLDVTATDYAYGGIPDTIDAGPTLLTLDNTGTELHHIVVFRVDDGVTDTLDELAAQSHQPGSNLTPVSAAIAPPDHTGHGFLLLEPGRHVAFCFIPTGATPDHLTELESGELDGPPHYEHGMLVEFQVN